MKPRKVLESTKNVGYQFSAIFQEEFIVAAPTNGSLAEPLNVEFSLGQISAHLALEIDVHFIQQSDASSLVICPKYNVVEPIDATYAVYVNVPEADVLDDGFAVVL